MKIQYTYVQNGTPETDVWQGDSRVAIEAAAVHLGAISTKRGYVYLAEENDEAYRVTKAEMMQAGAAILSHADDWYSIWCSNTGKQLSRKTRNKYFPHLA